MDGLRREARGASGFLLISALTVMVAACGQSKSSGSTTVADAAVAADAAAMRVCGERLSDDVGITKARSERGAAISPVDIDTSRMHRRQRAQVGLGSYLVNAAGDCTGCHTGSAGYLGGGVPFPLDGQGHIVWTRNLTPDPATGMKLTLDQFKETIRTGRDFHTGATKMLVVMPWLYWRWQGDTDLEAIYAYLKAIPSVSNAVAPDVKDDLPLPSAIPFPDKYTDGDVVRALPDGQVSFDPRRGLAIAPKALPSHLKGGKARLYGVGSYIANATIGCNECHTHPDRTADSSHLNTAAFLTGGTVYVTPPPLQSPTGYVRAMSANLKGATFGFFSEPTDSYARFHDIMHTGTLVDETPVRPLAFPMFIIANSLNNLLDEDLRSLYAFMRRTAPTSGAADLERQPPARWCAAATDCPSGESCAASGECVGGPCSADADCGACQTCSANACQPPAPDSPCILTAN